MWGSGVIQYTLLLIFGNYSPELSDMARKAECHGLSVPLTAVAALQRPGLAGAWLFV